MSVSSRFFKVASACALATALTTLAIHLLPELWAGADTFEEQLRLRHNPIYAARLWVVILHCLLVVVSMAAVGARRLRAAPALVGLGFLGFLFFAVTEMLRTSLAIFALNRTWRAGYEVAADEATRAALRATIGAFSGVNAALFFLFSTAFLVGLVCYGFALLRAEGGEQKVGALLLSWAALSLPGYVDTVTGGQTISVYFDWTGPYFQPVARALIGVWLWKVSSHPASAGPA